MYIVLHHPGIVHGEPTCDVSQHTVTPILNSEPLKSIGGSECLFLNTGNQIKTCLGDAVIQSIILYRGKCTLSNLQDTTREKWATNEGFLDFEEADLYFSEKYGAGWDTRDMMAIHFRGEWVQDD